MANDTIPDSPFTGTGYVDRHSVESSHARIDQHEAVCAFRWAAVEKQLLALKEQIAAQGVEATARFNTISNRQWAAASTLVILLLGGIATMLLIYIQHLGGLK